MYERIIGKILRRSGCFSNSLFTLVYVQAWPRNLASTVKAFEKKILLWKAETVTTAASQIHLDLVKFTCVKNHKKIVSNSLENCQHNISD